MFCPPARRLHRLLSLMSAMEVSVRLLQQIQETVESGLAEEPFSG